MEIRKYTNSLCSTWSYAESLYEKWAEKMNLSFQEFVVCYALDTKGEMTQKEICALFSIPKQTVNVVVHDLRNKNFVVLLPSEKDKREKIIRYTEDGRKYAKKIFEICMRLKKQYFLI